MRKSCFFYCPDLLARLIIHINDICNDIDITIQAYDVQSLQFPIIPHLSIHVFLLLKGIYSLT